MDQTGQSIRYLSYEDIVLFNAEIFKLTLGYQTSPGIILNANSLHYLVEIVKAKINDQEIHQTLVEKAAVYMFNIITRHIFLDGNKRTGTICAFTFLELNRVYLQDSIARDNIVNFTLEIAKGNKTLKHVVTWLKNMVLVE